MYIFYDKSKPASAVIAYNNFLFQILKKKKKTRIKTCEVTYSLNIS